MLTSNCGEAPSFIVVVEDVHTVVGLVGPNLRLHILLKNWSPIQPAPLAKEFTIRLPSKDLNWAAVNHDVVLDVESAPINLTMKSPAHTAATAVTKPATAGDVKPKAALLALALFANLPHFPIHTWVADRRVLERVFLATPAVASVSFCCQKHSPSPHWR